MARGFGVDLMLLVGRVEWDGLSCGAGQVRDDSHIVEIFNDGGKLDVIFVQDERHGYGYCGPLGLGGWGE